MGGDNYYNPAAVVADERPRNTALHLDGELSCLAVSLAGHHGGLEAQLDSIDQRCWDLSVFLALKLPDGPALLED